MKRQKSQSSRRAEKQVIQHTPAGRQDVPLINPFMQSNTLMPCPSVHVGMPNDAPSPFGPFSQQQPDFVRTDPYMALPFPEPKAMSPMMATRIRELIDRKLQLEQMQVSAQVDASKAHDALLAAKSHLDGVNQRLSNVIHMLRDLKGTQVPPVPGSFTSPATCLPPHAAEVTMPMSQPSPFLPSSMSMPNHAGAPFGSISPDDLAASFVKAPTAFAQVLHDAPPSSQVDMSKFLAGQYDAPIFRGCSMATPPSRFPASPSVSDLELSQRLARASQ